MFIFFRPSTQSKPDKVTLLVNKFKEGDREKEDVPRKGSPFVSTILDGLLNFTTDKGSSVSSLSLLSPITPYGIGPKVGEGWDEDGPEETLALPPFLAPD